MTHYSAAYTATCKWDGAINPDERIKGEGEEEQVKGCLSKHWWLINVVLLFQPHLKQHLTEASCYLKGGKKHSPGNYLLPRLEFGGIHLHEHDKECPCKSPT